MEQTPREKLLERYRKRLNKKNTQKPPANRCGFTNGAEDCPFMSIPRLLSRSFFSGLARGLGMAIGFTVLGAAAFYFLRSLAYRNLPVIGDFIRELLTIIESNQK